MRMGLGVGARFMISVAGVLILLMAVNVLWSIQRDRQHAQEQLREEALIIAHQLLATRAFIAENQQKINCDSRGNFEFKHLNPAAVGRGIGDIIARSEKYSFKQTNLTVRNPANMPDAFEREHLLMLKNNPGMMELYGEDYIAGEKVFRYLLPLYYDSACLECHGGKQGDIDVAGYPKEGRELGDFAGAISIAVPMLLHESNLQQNALYQVGFIFALVVFILGCMFAITSNFISHPLGDLVAITREMGAGNFSKRIPLRNNGDEIDLLGQSFNDMAQQLRILYDNLEQKVEDRTQQLTKANRQLALQQKTLREMNEKLAKADRVKSEFLTSMSHELRTPLTAIIAFAELLLQKSEGLSELQQEYLQDILESGQQLLFMISDLLDYSKMEAGMLDIRPGIVDVAELMQAVERTLNPWAMKREITLRVHHEKNLPVIFADYDKVKRALFNLVANAIKFTPQGGQICLTAELTGARDKYFMCLSVRDNGIGIKAEELPRIFDAFWQADGSSSRQYSGTGLGLSLVKTIVEKHGGTVQVESVWGQGSTFRICLPV